jgi:pyruvate,water dikinase
VNCEHVVLQGLPGAGGRCTGVAFVLGPDLDVVDVPPGAVVVTRMIHPHLTPFLLSAAALVVEEGAVLQHAVVIARELGIPAVVGVGGATAMLPDGCAVTVDGALGTVTIEA